MKITRRQLKRIIREETRKLLIENTALKELGNVRGLDVNLEDAAWGVGFADGYRGQDKDPDGGESYRYGYDTGKDIKDSRHDDSGNEIPQRRF